MNTHGLVSPNDFALWTEQVGLTISTPALSTASLWSRGTGSILRPRGCSAADAKTGVDVRGRLSLSVRLPPALSDSPSGGYEPPRRPALPRFTATNRSTVPRTAVRCRGSTSATLM